MQLDMAKARNVLLLITEGKLSSDELSRKVLQEAATTIFGKPEAFSVSEESNLRMAARDLLNIAEACDSEPPPVEQPPATSNSPMQNAAASNLPDDEAFKDRFTRLFASSPAFKICTLVLGVGTALFGVNLGVLSFDMSAVNRIKADASIAVNDAKTQADSAKIAVRAAVADIEQSKPSTDVIVGKVIERIDIGDTRQRVVAALGEKLDRDVRGQIDRVVVDLEAKAKPLKAENDALVIKLNGQKDAINELAEVKKKNIDQLEVFDKQQKLVNRWTSAVEVAEKTAADQGMAKILWTVLRQDALILSLSFITSLLVLGVAGIFVVRSCWRLVRSWF